MGGGESVRLGELARGHGMIARHGSRVFAARRIGGWPARVAGGGLAGLFAKGGFWGAPTLRGWGRAPREPPHGPRGAPGGGGPGGRRPSPGAPGQTQAAKKNAKKKKKPSPAEAQAAVEAAAAQIEAGKSELAVEALTRTVAAGHLPPAIMAKALYYRAIAYRHQNKPAQAIA